MDLGADRKKQPLLTRPEPCESSLMTKPRCARRSAMRRRLMPSRESRWASAQRVAISRNDKEESVAWAPACFSRMVGNDLVLFYTRSSSATRRRSWSRVGSYPNQRQCSGDHALLQTVQGNRAACRRLNPSSRPVGRLPVLERVAVFPCSPAFTSRDTRGAPSALLGRLLCALAAIDPPAGPVYSGRLLRLLSWPRVLAPMALAGLFPFRVVRRYLASER